jgi:hypothetical protein
MKRDVVLVEGVRAIAPVRKGAKSRTSRIRVTFASGAEVTLDPSDPREKVWAEVLESLRANKLPAYVELTPDSRHISALMLPSDQAVLNVREASPAGDLEVEFDRSHAVHYLRRDSERFDELRDALEKARRGQQRVLVTKSLDGTAIVDVRSHS